MALVAERHAAVGAYVDTHPGEVGIAEFIASRVGALSEADQLAAQRVAKVVDRLRELLDADAVPADLPVSPGGYGSYQKTYTFRASQNWTPAAITREVTSHFDTYFPFTGCGPAVFAGKQCSLDAVPGVDVPQPVTITDVDDNGFAIESRLGHVEG